MKSYKQASSLLTQAAKPTPRSIPRASLSCVQRPQQRTFLSNPLETKLQTLTATRTVAYPASAIYTVVSDVSQYQYFLPFCRESTVTKTSAPDANGVSWPEEAKLVVGYNNDISETFWSRVYCDGSLNVEAVAGETETTLDADTIAHHGARNANGDPTREAKILTNLLTRWTLRPFPFRPGPLKSGEKPQQTTGGPAKMQTEVNLMIEYKFANPIYAAMSSAAAPKVAEYMMAAFEKRVKGLLEGPSTGGSSKSIGTLEGILSPKGDSSS